MMPTDAKDPEPGPPLRESYCGRYDASVVCAVTNVHPECYGSALWSTGFRDYETGLRLYSKIDPVFPPRVQCQSFVDLNVLKDVHCFVNVYVVWFCHMNSKVISTLIVFITFSTEIFT